MTQLAETVSADDEFWTLDVLPTTQYVAVEDETVEVRAPFPSQYYTLTGETLPPRIRVRRGVGGTTAAGHNSGSALTPVYGLGGGAGGAGVTVDNQSDPPAEVTTLIAPGADLSTPGEADLSSLEGVQTIRLLGPFRVNFNTAGITAAEGIKAFDLDAGAIVFAVRAEVITAWDADIDLAQLTIGVGGAAYASGDWYTARQYFIGSNVTSPADANTGPEPPFVTATPSQLGSVHRAVTAGAVVVAVTATGGATAGALDVYALIAEPA